MLAPGQAPQRKLRPIAQCDALIKVVESAAAEEEMHRLRAFLEPKQLGIATRMGPSLQYFSSADGSRRSVTKPRNKT